MQLLCPGMIFSQEPTTVGQACGCWGMCRARSSLWAGFRDKKTGKETTKAFLLLCSHPSVALWCSQRRCWGIAQRLAVSKGRAAGVISSFPSCLKSRHVPSRSPLLSSTFRSLPSCQRGTARGERPKNTFFCSCAVVVSHSQARQECLANWSHLAKALPGLFSTGDKGP